MQNKVLDVGGDRGEFRYPGGLLKCERRPFRRQVIRRGTMTVLPDALLPTLTIPHFRRPGEYLLHPVTSMTGSDLAAVHSARSRLTVIPEPGRRDAEVTLVSLDPDEAPPFHSTVAPDAPAEPDEHPVMLELEEV